MANTLLASQPDLEVLLINGVRESGAFYFPKGMDSVTLPTYLKTPEGKYLPRSLGGDIHHLVALRAGIIRAALDAFNPDIVVVDNVPRGAMAELNAVLPLLKRKNARLILGLRDIIDEPERVLQQWEKLDNAAAIRDYYSDIWVYGDARFYDLTKAYKLDASIRKKSLLWDIWMRLRSPSGRRKWTGRLSILIAPTRCVPLAAARMAINWPMFSRRLPFRQA
ncbi:hypothetical protein QNH14_14415 [Apirhabdus apintestini]|nr:hypothetical protein QNH14_14415 [Enterobacteriaceae bacterium CA-0114]